MEFEHIPVMLSECLEGLDIRPEGVYIDGTAGGAGHAREIARRLSSGGRLIALDKDPEAVQTAAQRLAEYPQATVLRRDFREIPAVLRELDIPAADGILLDLGVSSHQLDTPERGFSYSADAPLDMRMSEEGPSARDLVNGTDAAGLTRILRDYGEEKFAARIAEAIVRRRQTAPIERTGELAEIVRESIPAAARREGGNPAKRTFQAIRIAVNGELDSLEACLDTAFDSLAPGGRFVILTFHSLEDRMVKQKFAGYCQGCICPPDFPVCVCGRKPRAELVNHKPVTASPEEQIANKRSQSAKLRVLRKL